MLALTVSSYWYGASYIAMGSPHNSAPKKDANAFNQGVDYCQVLQALKGQMFTPVSEIIGAPAGNGILAHGAMVVLPLIAY